MSASYWCSKCKEDKGLDVFAIEHRCTSCHCPCEPLPDGVSDRISELEAQLAAQPTDDLKRMGCPKCSIYSALDKQNCRVCEGAGIIEYRAALQGNKDE